MEKSTRNYILSSVIKNSLPVIAVLSFILLVSTNIFAASADTVTINYQVSAINEILITDDTASVIVNEAFVGEPIIYGYDEMRYSITTNCATDTKKITGSINSNMPSGIDMFVEVIAPTGATSSPDIVTTTPVDLMNNIDAVYESDLSIYISIEADVLAGVHSSTERVLNLTMIDR